MVKIQLNIYFSGEAVAVRHFAESALLVDKASTNSIVQMYRQYK